MTVRIGGLGIELIITEPPPIAVTARIESDFVEVMSSAPGGTVEVYQEGAEVMSTLAIAPPGVEQPIYLSRRRRIRTNALIT